MLTERASVVSPIRMVGSTVRRVVPGGALVVCVCVDVPCARRGRVCCDPASSCANATEDTSRAGATRKTMSFERKQRRICFGLSSCGQDRMTGEIMVGRAPNTTTFHVAWNAFLLAALSPGVTSQNLKIAAQPAYRSSTVAAKTIVPMRPTTPAVIKGVCGACCQSRPPMNAAGVMDKLRTR